MNRQVLNLRRATTRLIRAEVAASWGGSQPVASRYAIEQELNNATTNFNSKLSQLAAVHRWIPVDTQLPKVYPGAGRSWRESHRVLLLLQRQGDQPHMVFGILMETPRGLEWRPEHHLGDGWHSCVTHWTEIQLPD